MLPRVNKADLGIVEDNGTVRQYMLRGEQEVLLALVGSVQPRAMIEIGVNIGRTAQAVLQHIGSIEQYIGIDVGPEYRFEIPAQSIERPDEPGHLVKNDPRFEMVWRNGGVIGLKHPCGVVFIDGDHGRNAVTHDSMLATHLVQPGGLIIWHDYGNPSVQVTPVLDQLLAEGRDLWHVEATWLAFEHR
jgi:predicted O-methyltransferase YrrM